ncbi:MerR family DNA-binding transcriptional regulator [Nocardiopsis sp. NPDC101807]|uniref:MerR family DNA-binding transcriptional regulator n=1 Tax=Nocardiopsis sp. NPDC101807 TaxID=3364339 RepID=UPI0037FE4B68
MTELSGPGPLRTPGEVARVFRVDSKTINRWSDKGVLTALHTLGGHRRCMEAQVYALLERRS